MLGGVLAQDKDTHTETREDLKQVTTLALTEQEVEDLLFANKIVKHCKSNAIYLLAENSRWLPEWDRPVV